MEERTPMRPLGLGEILDVAINIVLKNWRTLLKAVLVVVIPVQIISIAILASTIPDADFINNQNTFSGNDTTADTSTDELWTFFAGIGVVALLSFILTALATAACFKAVSDAYLGAKPDWRESISFARGRFLSVLWVTVLVGLGASFAMLALIVPGIWLYFAWAVALPALLFEDRRGRKALGRSFELVKGRWWPTFGVLLVGFILASVVGGIVSGLISALALTDVGDSVFGAAVLNGISTGVGQVITTPVQVAIVAVVYYDLRVRKEGFDLQLLIERLGVTPEEGVLPRAAQPVVGWQTPGGPPPTAPGWQPQEPPPGGAQQWQGPPPTAPQEPPQQPQQWEGPPPQAQPPAPAPGPPPPSQPAPPAEGGGNWAPPQPPGDREDRERPE